MELRYVRAVDMAHLENVGGAWGLLPLVIPAFAFLAACLGALAFRDGMAHRVIGGAVLAFALVIAGVRTAGWFGLATPVFLVSSFFVVTAAAAWVRRDVRFLDVRWQRAPLAKDVWPLVALGALAVGVALLTAYMEPVWHWDSMGYHLPYVKFFLAGHGQAGVPRDLPYLSTYPHNVELFTVALRTVLPDDRLIDIAQLPFGILGAMATAGIARQLGAERSYAIAAGCAWLVVPAVFLQLPSNYADVASAACFLAAVYFWMAPPSALALLVAGVALGLFLGCKPNAPVAVALLGLALLVRGVRTKHVLPSIIGLCSHSSSAANRTWSTRGCTATRRGPSRSTSAHCTSPVR